MRLPRGLFLKWALIVSLTFVGWAIAGFLGGFEIVYNADATKISFGIMLIFIMATVYCGILTWRASALLDEADGDEQIAGLKEINQQTDDGWFAANLCEKLGLLGTVFGFLIMLFGGFNHLQMQSIDQQAIQKLLESISAGMSTAFVTTLVGLLCSIPLSLQYQNLCRTIDRKIK